MKGQSSLCAVLLGCTAVFKKRHPLQYFWQRNFLQHDPTTNTSFQLSSLKATFKMGSKIRLFLKLCKSPRKAPNMEFFPRKIVDAQTLSNAQRY